MTVLNITRSATMVLNLIAFSCSSGSFSAITPWLLPKLSHLENRLKDFTMLVAFPIC